MLNPHFRSSPVDSTRASLSHTTPVDSASGELYVQLPRLALPRETCQHNPPPGTRKSPELPP